MATDNDPKLAAEQRARVLIDRQLVDAGWSVQDKKDLNLFAAQGVACREVVMKPVSYTHLRAHETVLDLVCRLLLEKTTHTHTQHTTHTHTQSQ